MSTGSIAIRDFNLLAQSDSLKLDDVTVCYQYGNNNTCYVSHCQINFDMYSSEWSILVIDNTNTLCFDKFTDRWQHIVYYEDKRTLIIKGTDSRSQPSIPYLISITL